MASAALLIRLALADGMPVLLVAAARLAVATAVLVPLARRDPAGRALPLAQQLVLCGAGLCLALHFWAWIASLQRTSVAVSTVLVTTTPLWVALASALWLRERVAAATWAGLALSLGGTALLVAGPLRAGDAGQVLTGGLLALAGAWASAAYLLLGRHFAARLPLRSYLVRVWGIAAVLLLAAALAGGRPPAVPGAVAFLACLALGLGPQLLGHGAINLALRHLGATAVALALLGEPVGAALLAWAVLGERPDLPQACGFLLILAGIAAGMPRARAAPGP